MPQCQFPVFCYFWFQKVLLEILSELHETKGHVPIFPTRTRSPKERRRRAIWCGPLGTPPTPPLRLYIASDAKTKSYFQKSSAAPLPSMTSFGGQKSLFRHAAGTGNCPRRHLHRLHRHLHRRCWLPWWGGSSSPPRLRALPVAMWSLSLLWCDLYVIMSFVI